MNFSQSDFGTDFDQPQSTFEMASDGQRIAGFLIDMILASFLWLIPLVGALAGAAYLLTRDALPFLDGQSIGKKVMKTRAVDMNGQPLTENWQSSILRNILFLIPFLSALLELIILVTSKDKLRLGDQWAKTQVIVDPNS